MEIVMYNICLFFWFKEEEKNLAKPGNKSVTDQTFCLWFVNFSFKTMFITDWWYFYFF